MGIKKLLNQLCGNEGCSEVVHYQSNYQIHLSVILKPNAHTAMSPTPI
jgi:hypothetical protein